MTINTFTSGVNTSFSSELNQNFNSSRIVETFAGTDFDTSVSLSSSATSSSDEAYFESSALAPTDIGVADYLIVNVGAFHTVFLNGGASGYAQTYLNIQTKPVGGSYSDSLALTQMAGAGIDTDQSSFCSTFSYVHTLTNAEKTDGVQIKILTQSKVSNSDNSSIVAASVSNKFTYLQLGY